MLRSAIRRDDAAVAPPAPQGMMGGIVKRLLIAVLLRLRASPWAGLH